MENLKQYLPLGFFAIVVIGSLCFFYYSIFYTPKVVVGDVWRWSYGHADNPYENVKITDYKVLDVRDGWVRSMNIKDSTIDIEKQEFFKHYDLISRGGAILIYLPRKK